MLTAAGLNAFANQGFLPHDGYATASQFIDATMNVVGMGFGLASFLAVYGSVIDGNGVNAWSIGGTPLKQGKAGGNGITNSHNKYVGTCLCVSSRSLTYGTDTRAMSPPLDLICISSATTIRSG